jgi:hypothetical protein
MRFPTRNVLFLLLFYCLTQGCASIEHSKVSNDDTDNGIRYYNASPYLLVYSNGKGGIVTQILYIADPFKKMSAKPKSFMASAQTTMEFEKGIYKNGKSTIDATGFPTAIVNAVKTAGTAFISAMNIPDKKSREVPAPHLYKIVVKGSDILFIGGQGDISIKVNLLNQKAEVKKEETQAADGKEENKKKNPPTNSKS